MKEEADRLQKPRSSVAGQNYYSSEHWFGLISLLNVSVLFSLRLCPSVNNTFAHTRALFLGLSHVPLTPS